MYVVVVSIAAIMCSWKLSIHVVEGSTCECGLHFENQMDRDGKF